MSVTGTIARETKVKTSLVRSFEQHDFNDCFMYKNVHANHALWTNIFENNSGQ